jgi:SRSO17 transposase
VRPAEGAQLRDGRHLPGDEAWPVGERRASGGRKYYLANLPADAPLEGLAALIKARRVCEQARQQLKEELGLDHFEGRSWRGLHHHALLCRLALAFLQHLRPRERGESGAGPPGPPPRPTLPEVRRRVLAALTRVLLRCPHCRQRFARHLRL